MLDQTFSAKNFMNVYSQENRMGRIPVETMGQGFQTVVEEMKTVNSELQELKSLKKSKKTDDIKKKIDELKKKQKDLKENKQKVLFEELQGLSKQVNSYAFHFKLAKVWIGDKMGLTRERVRQIREKSITKLRESGNIKILAKYLG